MDPLKPINLGSENKSIHINPLRGKDVPKEILKTIEERTESADGIDRKFTPEKTELTIEASEVYLDTKLEKACDTMCWALRFPENKKAEVLNAILFIAENRDGWEKGNKDLSFNKGLLIDYNSKLKSITLITSSEGDVDFDSLFMENPLASGLSDEEFSQYHLFIIKNQVRQVRSAQISKEHQEGRGLIGQDVYFSTKDNVGTQKNPAFLKRSLMFTADNQVIMHINKSAFKKIIGTGSFKVLSTAIDLKTGKELASARMLLDEPSNLVTFNKELYWGNRFKGRPHFVQMYGSVIYASEKQDLSRPTILKGRILYERLQGADLLNVLNNESPPLTADQRLSITKQIIAIVSDLHKDGVALKDIKPDNFFIQINRDDSLEVTLIDFGFLQNMTEPNTPQGTFEYQSPEYRNIYLDRSLNSSTRKSAIQEIDRQKADIWALGLTICASLEPDEWRNSVRMAVQEANYYKEREIDLPGEPIDKNSMNYLIWRMLQINPNERITARELDRILNPENFQSKTFGKIKNAWNSILCFFGK